jgi:hypothetical protein
MGRKQTKYQAGLEKLIEKANERVSRCEADLSAAHSEHRQALAARSALLDVAGVLGEANRASKPAPRSTMPVKGGTTATPTPQ